MRIRTYWAFNHHQQGGLRKGVKMMRMRRITMRELLRERVVKWCTMKMLSLHYLIEI